MSYAGIKTGLKDIIEALQLSPSNEMIDFDNASPNEFANRYILFASQGNLEDESSETLASRVYDKQMWILQVAYSKGQHSQLINLDELNRKREELIKSIDDPANWTSFARMLNVAEWDVEDFEHYFVLNIRIEITDTIIY